MLAEELDWGAAPPAPCDHVVHHLDRGYYAVNDGKNGGHTLDIGEATRFTKEWAQSQASLLCGLGEAVRVDG